FNNMCRKSQEVISGENSDKLTLFDHWKASNSVTTHYFQCFECGSFRFDCNNISFHNLLNSNSLALAAEPALRQQTQQITMRNQSDEHALVILDRHMPDVTPVHYTRGQINQVIRMYREKIS